MMKLDMPVDIRQSQSEVSPQRGRYAHLFSEYADDEAVVRKYWESRGCLVERLDSQDRRKPDFSLHFANGALAICEVKSFGGPDTGASDYSLEYSEDMRISNVLYSGIAQVLGYEPKKNIYRILFFVNHNDKLRFDSLVKMLDGEWDPIKKTFLDRPSKWSSEARMKRKGVDLYLWLRDTTASSSEFPSLHWGRLDRVNEIQEAMQLNPKQIRLIPAA